MKRRSLFLLIFVAFFAVGAMVADNVFRFGATKTVVDNVTPVGVVFSGLGSSVSGFFGNLGNISNLQRENKDLERKLNDALAEVASLSEAKKENESLKNDLKFKKESDFVLIPANVIFFDPTNIRDTITIDLGKNDGIKTGDPVVSQGFLIGRIESVTEKTSKLLLISDPKSAIPVSVVNSSVTGIVKGKIGADLILDQVPQSEKVNIGDLLVTSGLGGQYPKGLLLGKIENVQESSGSIFKTIEVRPMIELNRLERVMVIKL